MKKLICLASILFCSLAIVSCEDDNDFTKVEVVDHLAGKWELKKIGGLNAQNSLNYTDVQVAEGCHYDNFVFGEGATFTETDFDSAAGPCTEVSTSGTYEFVDGNIVLTNGATVETYDVQTFSDTTLELVYTDPVSEELVFLRFIKA